MAPDDDEAALDNVALAPDDAAVAPDDAAVMPDDAAVTPYDAGEDSFSAEVGEGEEVDGGDSEELLWPKLVAEAGTL